MSHIVSKILIGAMVLVLIGLCLGPFLGFNNLPSGDDEADKN
jgi:hypothetical protein